MAENENNIEVIKEILPGVINIKNTDSFLLPSKGLIYKKDDNIPSTITLRRMTTKEDKLRYRNLPEDKIRRDLLQACVVGDIDVNKLKLTDANFLLFKLRVLSLLEDRYKVSLRCPFCGTEFIHELNLSEVPIKYFDETDLDKFDIDLKISKAKIHLKYPSLLEIIETGDILNNAKKRNPNIDVNELSQTYYMILYIDTVNNNKLLDVELEEYVNNMDIIDERQLMRAIYKLEDLYGVDDSLATLCPSCNKEVKHGLPITSELFNPSYEDESK